jgi:hypothetical protein
MISATGFGVRKPAGLRYPKEYEVNKDEFENVAQRLREIDDIVTSLDESIRSQAFAILKPYVDDVGANVHVDAPRPTAENRVDQGEQALLVDPDIAATFLEKHASDKPSDNVKAIGALIYSIYGNCDFTTSEVNAIAHEVGVEVPDRVDVTLGGASVDKKNLFQKRRSGVYRPTANGRRFFKDEYGVSSPGTSKRPDLTT